MIEKSKNVITSFKYAFQGVFSAIKTERNLKIHISIMILVIIAGIFLKISKNIILKIHQIRCIM